RSRNAGSVPAAQALGAALGALYGIRADQASALQPLELDPERQLGKRTLGYDRARLRSLRRGESHFRNDGKGRISILATLRVHSRSRVAGTPCVSDVARRRGVLSKSSQRQEGRRRKDSHPLG